MEFYLSLSTNALPIINFETKYKYNQIILRLNHEEVFNFVSTV